jgi:pyridoxamine 5'-phosphate oxidase family protein
VSFSEPELAFMSSQPVGRLATVQPDGTLQVNPVGFTYDAELDAFEITGFRMSDSQKFRNIVANIRCGTRRGSRRREATRLDLRGRP